MLTRNKSSSECLWREMTHYEEIWGRKWIKDVLILIIFYGSGEQNSAVSDTRRFKCFPKVIAPPKDWYFTVRTETHPPPIGSTANNPSAVYPIRGEAKQGAGNRGHRHGDTSCGVQEAGSGRTGKPPFTGPWWRTRGWTQRRSRCSWWWGRTCWCGRWPSGTRASPWSCAPPVWLKDTRQHGDVTQRVEEELQAHRQVKVDISKKL